MSIGTEPEHGEGSAVRVLVVDDDPEVADTTATFLERSVEAIEAVAEPTVSAGLERLSEGTFDCVVSDYRMPDDDGIEFLERVRETDPELPFVLYTGEGSDEVANEAITKGATDYIRREIGVTQYTVLANRITDAVEQYRNRRELRRYRTLAETVPDGVFVLDAAGRMACVNERWARTVGYDRAALEGKPFSELVAEGVVPPKAPEAYTELVADLLSSTTDRSEGRIEIRAVPPNDDSEHVYEAHVSLLPYDESFRGCAVVVRDVTGD